MREDGRVGRIDYGLGEEVNIVVALTAGTVGSKEATFLILHEHQPEIVLGRVEGNAHILDGDNALRARGHEQVELAQAGVSVGGEVQFVVGRHVGKHFVPGSIDVLTHIYGFTKTARGVHIGTVDIDAARTARAVRSEIKRFTIARKSGGAVPGQRIIYGQVAGVGPLAIYQATHVQVHVHGTFALARVTAREDEGLAVG